MAGKLDTKTFAGYSLKGKLQFEDISLKNEIYNEIGRAVTYLNQAKNLAWLAISAFLEFCFEPEDNVNLNVGDDQLNKLQLRNLLISFTRGTTQGTGGTGVFKAILNYVRGKTTSTGSQIPLMQAFYAWDLNKDFVSQTIGIAPKGIL